MNELSRLSVLKEYLNEDPEDAFSRYLLALELIKAGNDDEAGIHMEHLNQFHPEYLPNYYHFGKLLERTGQKEKAVSVYKTGIKLALLNSDNHTKNELESALELCEE